MENPNNYEHAAPVLGDWLWIGDRHAAEDADFIARAGITDVLTVALEVTPAIDPARNIRIGLHDEHPGKERNSDEALLRVAEAIDRVCEPGGIRLLVHCAEGRNRSVASVIAYLIRGTVLGGFSRYRYTVLRAYHEISEKYPKARVTAGLLHHIDTLFFPDHG